MNKNYVEVNKNYIQIKEGSRIIENSQFRGNENLESIFIPQSVVAIEERAFFGCKNLKEVTLPKNLDFIGRAAFYYCRGLKRIVIPSGIKKIEKEVFLECSLNNVIFPSSLEVIDDLAFAYNKFTTINLPKNIKELGHGSFYKARHVVAYNSIEKGLNYAMHNLKPGLAISAIPWIAHRLTLKDSKSDEVIFSIYIAGSYRVSIRNTILSLYNGSNFDIEQYDSLFDTISSIDDKINVSLLRLKFPYRLNNNYRKIYTEYLNKNAFMVAQKLIYDNDAVFLKYLYDEEIIEIIDIDKLILSAYEKTDNIEMRAYLLKKKNSVSKNIKESLYL